MHMYLDIYVCIYICICIQGGDALVLITESIMGSPLVSNDGGRGSYTYKCMYIYT